MFDPLRVAQNRSLLLRLKLQQQTEKFRCTDHTTIDNGDKTPVARYTLQNIVTGKYIILEVFKERSRNFHIQAYRMLETYDFTATFAAMLGTPVMAFSPHEDSLSEDTIYNRILASDEKVEIVKYICDTDELPAHPRALGYHRDGNGNWYQLMEQSQGRIKRFTDKKFVRCWEYENSSRKRLLIELSEKMQQKHFHIYEGIKITRKEINIVHAISPLPTLLTSTQ